MPTKLERCVKKLKKKKGIRSPYAVCKASIMKKKRKKQLKKEIKDWTEKDFQKYGKQLESELSPPMKKQLKFLLKQKY